MVRRGSQQLNERGAVSLFVVIFTALLLIVITVSFITLMISDQEQASQADVSQSAYDASQAGTEDAKRLLLIKEQCDAGSPNIPASACTAANSVDWNSSDPSCDMVQVGLGLQPLTWAGNGTSVQTSTTDTSGKSYDQAYTCVKIQLKTTDYEAALQANESVVTPVVPDSGRNYNFVKVSWYTQDDLNSSTTGTSNISMPGAIGTTLPLYSLSSWSNNRPPVLRFQFMQMSSNGTTLGQFDNNGPGNQSDDSTVFLYPQPSGAVVVMIGADSRRSSPTNLQSAKCTNLTINNVYSCSAIIQLPDPVGGGTRVGAFARLTSYYSGAHVSFSLYDGNPAPNDANLVKLSGVEPEIDSTGRTADLFRRVVTRVSLSSTGFPYPMATVELAGNLCKDFSVTDTSYIPGTCTP